MARHWQPTSFERFDSLVAGSSTQIARILTDEGHAFVKVLGNPEGPHALAREFVGTSLAKWFGLTTLDFALLLIDAAVDVIKFPAGNTAESGHAFVTRAVKGSDWGGDAKSLRLLENPDDIPRLVVFDTWIRNRDRHAPESMGRRPNLNNVFLTSEKTGKGRFRLLAIDHTHCFDTGDLSSSLTEISKVRDPEIYGLFPGFVDIVRNRKAIVLESLQKLRRVDRDRIKSIVDRIPKDWDVSLDARNSLVEFLCRRAEFVADTIVERMKPTLWPKNELPFPPNV